MYFSRYSFYFIYFDVIIRQRLKKKVQASWTFFFSRANEVKSCSLALQMILRMLRDLIIQSRVSHSLYGNAPYVWKALLLRNRNRFYLNSRSYSEINRACSNKWALYKPRH